MPRPDRSIYIAPITTGSLARWDIEDAYDALDAHEAGQFESATKLFQAMRREPRISACLRVRVLAAVGLPFELLPPKEASNLRRASQLAKFAAKWWETSVPETVIRRLCRDKIVLGVALAQILWTVVDGLWVPTLEYWSPEHLWWRADNRSWEVMTQGGLVPIELNTGKWFLWVDDGEKGWMDASIQALTLPFLARTLTFRDWNRYGEKHGLPILGIKEPAEADPDNAEKFFKKLAKVGRDGVARLPQGIDGEGYDLKYIEASDQAWKTFEAFQSVAATDTAIELLGQNLTTEVSSGSLAAAKVQEKVRQDLLEADADSMLAAFWIQVSKPWALFNFGTPELAPKPTWDAEPPEDKQAAAQTLLVSAQAIEVLIRAGVDVSPLLEPMGLKMKQPESSAQPTPNQSAPATSVRSLG